MGEWQLEPGRGKQGQGVAGMVRNARISIKRAVLLTLSGNEVLGIGHGVLISLDGTTVGLIGGYFLSKTCMYEQEEMLEEVNKHQKKLRKQYQ